MTDLPADCSRSVATSRSNDEYGEIHFPKDAVRGDKDVVNSSVPSVRSNDEYSAIPFAKDHDESVSDDYRQIPRDWDVVYGQF